MENIHESHAISKSACCLSDLEVFELLLLLKFTVFEDQTYTDIARKYIDRFSKIALLQNEF